MGSALGKEWGQPLKKDKFNKGQRGQPLKKDKFNIWPKIAI
jgi:hypothetical protein